MNYLAQNLEGLRKRYPALVQAMQENPGGLLTVVPSRGGIPSATYEGRWVHSEYDPRKEAQAWAETQLLEWKAGELGVVLGVGLLYHIEALVALKPQGAMLVVIVPNVAELRDAASTRPMETWVNKVDWMWGMPAVMAEELAAKSAPLRFMTYGAAARLHTDAHRDLEAVLRRIVAAKQAGRIHVAVVGPIYGGSLGIARHTVAALESLGHRVSWLDQSLHHASYDAFGVYREPRHRLTIENRFTDMLSSGVVTHLADDPPDLVLALAQAPMNLAVLEHLRKKKFLTAMWFVENYRHLTYWRQVAGGYDYWFVIQQARCFEALKRAGARHVNYL